MSCTPPIHTEWPTEGFPTPDWPLGYVYVAEVPADRLRIGRTRTPHKHLPPAFTRLWVSTPHLGTVTNELALINAAVRLGGKRRPGSWFTGITLADLLPIIATLNLGIDPIDHLRSALVA
jgi:hypothetical protein